MKAFIIGILVCFSLLDLAAQVAHPVYEEKIALFTDRDIYISGEKIWFRVDCGVQSGNPDSLVSRIVYLELYDQNNNSIGRSKFMIEKGLVSGHIEIPSDINTGNYFLRAYTQYSRNFHPYANSALLLCVINPLRPLPGDEVIREDQVLAIPSGGKLVSGILSKLAVRLTPSLCRRHPEIILADETGHVIENVRPLKNGLALLVFSPEFRRKYTVIVKSHDGQEIRHALPDVLEKGTLLQTGTMGLSVKAGITSTEEQAANYDIEVRSAFGNILYQNTIRNGNTLIIPVENTGARMVYVLLKENGAVKDVQPVFTGSENETPVALKAGGSYGTRENISIKYEVPRGMKDVFVSVSASDAHFDEAGLLPWYLPYNPALFLNYINQLPVIADSLMRQIEATMILYADLMRKQEFIDRLVSAETEWIPEIRDAGISGRVIDRFTRKPLENIDVFAAVVNENNQLHVYKTTGDGKFYFTLNHLSGTHNVYLCPKPADSLKMELLINSDFDNSYPTSAGIIPFIPDTTYLDRINTINLNARLSKIFPEYAPRLSNYTIYHPVPSPDRFHTVMLSDYIEMPVMSEIFTEIVPFVTVKRRDNRFYFQVFDDKLGATYNEPLVLYDGIPVFNYNNLMNVDPLLIRKIDVTNATAYLGNFSADGVISITSHKKDFEGLSLPEGSVFIEFRGVNDQSYPVFPTMNSKGRYPDFRTLLYWGPLKPGTQDITLGASDNKGSYRVYLYTTSGKEKHVATTSFTIE